MRRITIEVEKGRRLVIYKEGGCNLEAYVDGIGWVIDDWSSFDWIPVCNAAQHLLADVTDKITLAA